MNLIDNKMDIVRGPWDPFQMSPIVSHHGVSARRFTPPSIVVERCLKEVLYGANPSSLELRGFYELD